MSRVVAAAAIALGGVLSVAAAAGGQQAAASISDVGWWSTNPAATAPEKGLAVSGGPSGAITVGAIRVMLLADRIDAAKLTLPEDGGVQASGAQLQVCPTPNAWSAGPKQPMDKAPKPECDRLKVALARGADGNWTADVTLLMATSSEDQKEVSLMVVPAGSGAVPLGFEVRFKPPVLEATGTSDTAASGDEFSSGSSSSDFGFGSDSSTSGFSSPPETFASPPSSSFADSSPLPSLSSAQTSGTFESTPTASEAAAGEVTAAQAPPPTAGAALPVAVAPRPESRGSRAGQALFFVLVSTIIGVGAGVGHARFRPAAGALA